MVAETFHGCFKRHTHRAVLFRYKNYVFLGDEVLPAQFDITDKNRIPSRGIVHVVDVSDIFNPRKVAEYAVPEEAVVKGDLTAHQRRQFIGSAHEFGSVKVAKPFGQQLRLVHSSTAASVWSSISVG